MKTSGERVGCGGRSRGVSARRLTSLWWPERLEESLDGRRIMVDSTFWVADMWRSIRVRGPIDCETEEGEVGRTE